MAETGVNGKRFLVYIFPVQELRGVELTGVGTGFVRQVVLQSLWLSCGSLCRGLLMMVIMDLRNGLVNL